MVTLQERINRARQESETYLVFAKLLQAKNDNNYRFYCKEGIKATKELQKLLELKYDNTKTIAA